MIINFYWQPKINMRLQERKEWLIKIFPIILNFYSFSLLKRIKVFISTNNTIEATSPFLKKAKLFFLLVLTIPWSKGAHI